MLRVGCQGPDVLELQRLLVARGLRYPSQVTDVFKPDLKPVVVDYQLQHIGQDKKPLKVDGEVWTGTWWSLNAPLDAQRSGIGASYRIPTGISPQRKAILEVALAEYQLDVREQPMGSNRGPVVDKYTGWTNQPAGDKGPPWCCFSATWVLHEAMGFYVLGERVGGCVRAYELAKKHGRWVDKNDPGAQIEPGDQWIMLYRDPVTGRFTGHGHTGICAAADASRFNTFEGNCGNRYKLGLRENAQPTFEGWIRTCDIGQPVSDFERVVFEAPSAAREATT
ncbi:MAG TPA: peptidoglycan-binding domain-containing protein [Polyangiales bacterium]|nr:peptidoglycan-binding domain-containing protein [Polyangiales bacterium]